MVRWIGPWVGRYLAEVSQVPITLQDDVLQTLCLLEVRLRERIARACVVWVVRVSIVDVIVVEGRIERVVSADGLEHENEEVLRVGHGALAFVILQRIAQLVAPRTGGSDALRGVVRVDVLRRRRIVDIAVGIVPRHRDATVLAFGLGLGLLLAAVASSSLQPTTRVVGR